jgi:hypothetical protein
VAGAVIALLPTALHHSCRQHTRGLIVHEVSPEYHYAIQAIHGAPVLS